jgi:integrase
MAAKRRRFGRVRKLPSGRWQARYPGPDGLDRPAPVTFRTKTDADAWLGVVEADMRRGVWIDPDAGRVAFGPYAKQWITERPLAPRTANKYERLFRLHLEPQLGGFDLVDITTAQVRSWRAERLAAGVGTPTVAGAYRLLRAIMATAVDDELVRRNPCRIPGADKDNSPERPVATIPEVFAIAGAMRKWYRALVLMAAFTSLRWGELIALRRRHIDLTAGFVTVRAAVTEIDSKLDVARPKSAAGVREVAIPEAIIPDLREHLRRWAEPGPNGRVFVGPKGATPRRSNFNRLWKEAAKKAGIDPEVGLRFHDLRHTGNHLTSRGASLRDVMNRMGHASTRAALIYQHADKDRERDIAAGLSQAITQALAASSNGHVAGTEATEADPVDSSGGREKAG